MSKVAEWYIEERDDRSVVHQKMELSFGGMSYAVHSLQLFTLSNGDANFAKYKAAILALPKMVAALKAVANESPGYIVDAKSALHAAGFEWESRE